MNTKEPAIIVHNLKKAFKLPHEQHHTLKSVVLNMLNGDKTFENQKVLKNLSFEVKSGEFLGVIGKNGSGKSTLLKLLAGIYHPDSGKITVRGKLTPFIELGVGFNQELTGRENVFLNGALLGLQHKDMLKIYDKIVEFAELEKFMDQKLKNYSSGMQVRLAFSIAIQAESDILLIDEVLAVGDANFQRKCRNYFKELKRSGKTVIFISHDANAVLEFCDRAIVIDNGNMLYNGNPAQAVALYNDLNFANQKKTAASTVKKKHYGNGALVVDKITIVNDSGKVQNLLLPYHDYEILLKLRATEKIVEPLVGLQITDASGNAIISQNNYLSNTVIPPLRKGSVVTLSVKFNNILHDGTYFVSAATKSKDKSVLYDQIIDLISFNVAGWQISNGMTHPETAMHVKVVE